MENLHRATENIHIDPMLAIQRIDAWLDIFILNIPNLILAFLLFLIFYGVGWIVKLLIHGRLKRRNRDNLGDVLGGFVRAAVTLMGVLIALTTVLPSLAVGDLVAGMGVSSVAIGFAFKDILQNWLAGLIILLRQPFKIGDQIRSGEYEGTVQYIQTRATIIRTYDGEKVIIPNSRIYTSEVVIKTAYNLRRSQYQVGIGYDDDISKEREVIEKVLGSMPGVQSHPGPTIHVNDLAASWVTLQVTWWTNMKEKNPVEVRADAIERIKAALEAAQISLPFPTEVRLLKEQ